MGFRNMQEKLENQNENSPVVIYIFFSGIKNNLEYLDFSKEKKEVKMKITCCDQDPQLNIYNRI